jgi:adenine/guanine phosphoribosyltransferase-like PRPP-binding protein
MTTQQLPFAEYLVYVLAGKQFNRTVARLAQTIQKSGIEFDAIAVCGIGGVSIGPALAAKLGKEIIIVRKDDDINNHSLRDSERSSDKIKSYVIVDDLVAGGRTVRSMAKKLKPLKCQAIFCYHFDRDKVNIYRQQHLKVPVIFSSAHPKATYSTSQNLDHLVSNLNRPRTKTYRHA